jgi:hypothetical protein
MSNYQFNDSHIHLTNYVQQGPDIRDYLAMMGDIVKRSVLFGLPCSSTGPLTRRATSRPRTTWQADAPLYYYSFTDAFLAMAAAGRAGALRAHDHGL